MILFHPLLCFIRVLFVDGCWVLRCIYTLIHTCIHFQLQLQLHLQTIELELMNMNTQFAFLIISTA